MKMQRAENSQDDLEEKQSEHTYTFMYHYKAPVIIMWFWFKAN